MHYTPCVFQINEKVSASGNPADCMESLTCSNSFWMKIYRQSLVSLSLHRPFMPIMQWPSQSTDLNLWPLLKIDVRRHHSSNLLEFGWANNAPLEVNIKRQNRPNCRWRWFWKRSALYIHALLCVGPINNIQPSTKIKRRTNWYLPKCEIASGIWILFQSTLI